MWSDQDVLYNCKADLHCIENRSIICNILCISNMLCSHYFSNTEAFEACIRFLHVMN